MNNSYFSKYYEITNPNHGEYWYRRRSLPIWHRWERNRETLLIHLKGLDEVIDEAKLVAAIYQFRKSCIRIKNEER